MVLVLGLYIDCDNVETATSFIIFPSKRFLAFIAGIHLEECWQLLWLYHWNWVSRIKKINRTEIPAASISTLGNSEGFFV